MWYFRGEINVQLLISVANQIDEGQVDDGTMNYHIILILPTNENIIKRGNQLNT